VAASAANVVVVNWLLRSFIRAVWEAQFMVPVSTVRPMAANTITITSA
jgi:hypothetical protein